MLNVLKRCLLICDSMLLFLQKQRAGLSLKWLKMVRIPLLSFRVWFGLVLRASLVR